MNRWRKREIEKEKKERSWKKEHRYSKSNSLERNESGIDRENFNKKNVTLELRAFRCKLLRKVFRIEKRKSCRKKYRKREKCSRNFYAEPGRDRAERTERKTNMLYEVCLAGYVNTKKYQNK